MRGSTLSSQAVCVCVVTFNVHMNYQELTSIESLFQAWDEFKKGKGKRRDVQVFARHLEDNLFNLHQKLNKKTYQHGGYHAFFVNDPKRRHIHKASVEDRIVHHLLYKYLYELWDKKFIYDSYSCRLEKGTHRAVKRLEKFTRIVSKNYTTECWALKLDIKKFFASVDLEILKGLIRKKIINRDTLWLTDEIIDSFLGGIPLGNLTSQVFANIYMDELDQFIKHNLKAKYYLRYADDFVLLSSDKQSLSRLIVRIAKFLEQNLNLELHPNKIFLRKFSWGIDFLGYIVLPHYILPRTKTKKRMFKRVNKENLPSYLGYLSHANSFSLSEELKNKLFLSILSL